MRGPFDQFLPFSAAALHILLAAANGDRHSYGIRSEIARRISRSQQSSRRSESFDLCRFACSGWIVLLFLMAVLPAASQATRTKPNAKEPTPQPAIPAILSAFDRYEVVAMPAAHGMKDVDDFILSLIRHPAFPVKVNDIAVECGNSLYQPVLDRYITGEDVPFTEVRKVWRNTTQSMCGDSGFYEQLFPLVRAINQNLPTTKRLRVLACDPPIDWDKVKTSEEANKFVDRDASTASVMEKEVLFKHRKALMLFGTFHLVHGIDDSAVSAYEKDYPNRTFVLSDLSVYDTNRPAASISPFALWPNPSIALTKGTWLGALLLSDIFPPGIMVTADCKAQLALFPPRLQKQAEKPLEHYIDAFLYLGPQEFRLKEPMPANIVVDADYLVEVRRREFLVGIPGASKSPKEIADGFVQEAQDPILEGAPKLPDVKDIEQGCLEQKKQGSPR